MTPKLLILDIRSSCDGAVVQHRFLARQDLQQRLRVRPALHPIWHGRTCQQMLVPLENLYSRPMIRADAADARAHLFGASLYICKA